MSQIKIGCCGFPVSKKRYYEKFKVVEIQKTFYTVVNDKLLNKWRSNAPEDFEFSLKAWMAVTHPLTSPVWRRVKAKPAGNPENYGFLKDTTEVHNAFLETLRMARALKSKIIVVQCPPSLKAEERNIENLEKLVKVAGEEFTIAFEVRNKTWTKDILRNLNEKLNVIIVTDPFKDIFESKIIYWRLHGRDGINYRYKYSEADIEHLVNLINSIEFEELYVMFNNIYMFEDALNLKKKLKL